MKKLIIGLVAVLGLATPAMAEHNSQFKVKFGPQITFAPTFGAGAAATFAANDLVAFSPTISLSVRGGLSLAFTNPIVFGFGIAPVAMFDFVQGAAYFGPSINLGFAGGAAGFGFGFATGVIYDVTTDLSVFSDLTLGVVPAFAGSAAIGVDYRINGPLSVFGALTIGFGGFTSVGLGLGVGYAF